MDWGLVASTWTAQDMDQIVLGIEGNTNTLRSILTDNEEGNIYLNGSPNFTRWIYKAIHGRTDRTQKQGSCGTAASEKRIIVSDICNGPVMGNYCDLALDYDASLLSSPSIWMKNIKVIATFADYERQ